MKRKTLIAAIFVSLLVLSALAVSIKAKLGEEIPRIKLEIELDC